MKKLFTICCVIIMHVSAMNQQGDDALLPSRQILRQLLALSTAMENGFNVVSTRLDGLEGRFVGLEGRVSTIEDNILGLGRQNEVIVSMLTNEFPKIGTQLDKTLRRLGKNQGQNAQAPALQRRMSRDFRTPPHGNSPREPEQTPQMRTTLRTSSTPYASPRTNALIMPELTLPTKAPNLNESATPSNSPEQSPEDSTSSSESSESSDDDTPQGG